jgi:hypothetical protein
MIAQTMRPAASGQELNATFFHGSLDAGRGVSIYVNVIHINIERSG